MSSLSIPRVHLFEVEDQPWFPATIRDLTTDYLHFIITRFALHVPAVALVADLLRRNGVMRIVDLCSGGGGPIPGLLKELEAHGMKPNVTLTDRFPNLHSFQRVAAESGGRIGFRSESVDARAVPRDLPGLRTMFNAFHHFAPGDAMAVLRDAAQARQPIGIFEIPERSLRTLAPMLLLTPLMIAASTPFIRPFLWRRLLWTYALPLVPLTCWWDGIVSQLRAYTPAEFQRLGDAAAAETSGYCWQSGQVPISSMRGPLTYLIGYPMPHL